MKQYLELMQKVLDEGTQKNDRTGTGTLSIFRMSRGLGDVYKRQMSPSGTNGPMRTAI